MKTNLFYSIVLSLFFTAGYSQTATFEGLGYINEPTPPFGYPDSEANGVSYDGSVVTGLTTSLNDGSNVREAFRWSEDTGMVGLGGLLEGGLFFSYARAVSDDGTTVVGYSNSESPEVGWEPFRWIESEGIIGLGDLVSENYSAEACDVSSNGSVIVGRSYTTSEPFRWENGEIQRIAEEGTFGEAWGVSADGSVITGSAIVDNAQQAFRWTEETGMTGLGFPDPYGMGGYSVGLKVSGDGTTIVGFQQYNFPDIPYSVFEAFRWTEETGRISLGQLSDVLNSEASDVSYDGSIVVGYGHAGSGIGWRAFIWTEENGMQNLQELLETEYGLDLTGWVLEKANAISGDGTTIVGTGINPDGNAEAWRVVIPTNIEPACEQPTDIIVNNITTTTADVIWTENGETSEWEIEYGETGFTQGEGVLISDNDGIIGETINGLEPATQYDVYVRAICESNESDWLGPVGFTTEIPPCLQPSDVIANTVTDSVVFISWTENGDAAQWEIEYDETGFTQGEGTTVLDNDGTPGETISGMEEGIDYDVYVRAICEFSQSEWAGPVTFNTEDMGINEQENQMVLYPNPTSGIINIQIKEKINAVSVYNAAGQKVPFNSLNKENTSIDLSNLPEGIYFIELNLNNKTFKRYKVIRK